jgi:hypothetical protein
MKGFKKKRKKICRIKTSLYICTPKTQVLCVGLVVQLVRMPPCHGGGRGFESRPDRKASEKSEAFWFLQSSFNINYTFKKIFYTDLIALNILLLIVWLSSITFSAIHLDCKWAISNFSNTYLKSYIFMPQIHSAILKTSKI